MGNPQRNANEILDHIRREKAKRREDVIKSVSDQIAQEMERQGISQLHLAALSGNSPSTVLRVLQQYDVRLSTLADIAAGLGYRWTLNLERLDE